MSFEQVIGLFNIWVGLMLSAAFLMYIGGLALWYVRLGTQPSYRDHAITYMKWGVAIMLVLVVLLGIVSFVQRHTQVALAILGLVIILVVARLIIPVLAEGDVGDAAHK